MSSPPHRCYLWLQGLPFLLGGINPLPVPPQIHREENPSTPTLLGALIENPFVVSPLPPNPFSQQFPPTSTMAQLGPPPPPILLPYKAGLNLPNLIKLINDPITHDPTWPTMPTKLPSNIPMFEGQVVEDPKNHIISFHIW